MDPGSLQRYVRRRIGFFVCGFLTLGILLLAVFKDKGWLDVRARAKQLKLVKPGEVVIILPEEKPPDQK